MTRTAEQVRRGHLEDFAESLVNAALNVELHRCDSRFVHEALDECARSLQRLLDAGAESPVQLEVADDCLSHLGETLPRASLQAARMLRACAERQIAALGFGRGMGATELHRFLDLLLWEANRPALERRNKDRALAAMGIRHISVLSRVPGDPSDRRAAIDAPGRQALRRYQDLAACLHQNHVRAHRDQQLKIDAANGVVEQAILQLASEPSGLLSLATQDQVDRFTVGHSVRVALLSLQVARAGGADREQLVQVGTAALLHDIGKSKVPQEILFKQTRLDPDEWHWMSQHPRLGAQILLEQPDLEPSAVGTAFCHHMRPSGVGYPSPAMPFQPSAVSRLVRICDVFEALTSVRPYKRALTPCEAYAVMFRAEDDFDQDWLRFFVHTLGLYPQGTRLLLDDGSEAVVLEQGSQPHLPTVRLLTGPAGGPVPAGAPESITLGAPTDGSVRNVAEVLVHDRTVQVPQPDLADPAILTQTPQHHCLRTPPTPMPKP